MTSIYACLYVEEEKGGGGGCRVGGDGGYINIKN